MNRQPAQIGTVWECLEFGLVVLIVGRLTRFPWVSRCLVLYSQDHNAGIAGQETPYIIPSAMPSQEKWEQVS